MCRFLQLKPPYVIASALHYIAEAEKCFNRYSKYLKDDFAPSNLESVILAKIPYFWFVLDKDNQFMGFVYLDNFVGNDFVNYSAELTTCFKPEAWGSFTGYSAKIFLKKCFDEFGLYKIRVLVYKDNFRTSALIKKSGFKYETTLHAETLRMGKMQDIDVYALYRTYYYKDEVKNEQ